MDKKDKKDRLMEPLDAARKNHSDQNLENIVETCESEDGLDEAAATPANVPVIRTAKKNSILYKVPVNKMTSCSKSSTKKKVSIEDITDLSADQSSIAEPEKYVHVDEYLDFKKFIHSEVQSIKAEIEFGANDVAAVHSSGMDPLVSMLIQSLKDRIVSLEKQLDEKQKIIEKLMDRPILEISKDQNREVEVNPPSKTTNPPETGKKAQSSCPNNENIEQKIPKTQEKELRNTKEQNSKEVGKEQDVRKEKAEKKAERKKIIIIGDSLLNGLEEKKMKRNHDIQIRPHSGASSIDISDHIRPVLRRNPDCIIVHAGTNDITKHEDTIKNIEEMVNEAKKMSPSTNIVVSELVVRHDSQQRKVKSEELNKRIKDLAKKLQIPVICHANINSRCLGKGQLHLNQRGNGFFARNLLDFIDNFYITEST